MNIALETRIKTRDMIIYELTNFNLTLHLSIMCQKSIYMELYKFVIT